MKRMLPGAPRHGACALSLAILTLVFCPSAKAHQKDAPGDHTHGTLAYDYTENRSPQWAAFELRMGPYLPRVDSEFSGATPYADSFGEKPRFSLGFEGSFQALRIPYFGTLGPGAGIHWFRVSGIAQFEDGTAGSAHTNNLWILPMYAVAVLRADVLAREFHLPIVPYAKGGFAWALWESRDAQSVSEGAEGDKARGIETGLQGQFGLMLHLNPLSPQAAVDMDAASGVNHAYLFAEWWISSVNSFGSGMQVGTNTWMAGLAVEY